MALETKAKYIFAWLLVAGVLYFLVQALVIHSYSFWSPFDGVVPFVPEFIWIYHTLIPVIVATTIFSMQRREVFFKTIVALSLSVVVLTAFHLIFPSYYPRQEIEPISFFSASLWLVELTRELDAACNTFPSGHVALAWILYFCIRDSDCAKRKKSLRGFYLLWAVLISLSTLFLKQHYVLDVVAGIVLAHISVVVSERVIQKGEYTHETTHPRRC
jgi:membrane-associated phospholipid phosphatase